MTAGEAAPGPLRTLQPGTPRMTGCTGAMLAAATARAREREIRVLSAVGVQSEARLPFAGLHQLLRSVLPLAERLPTRQRTALLAAFGMSDEAPGAISLHDRRTRLGAGRRLRTQVGDGKRPCAGVRREARSGQ